MLSPIMDQNQDSNKKVLYAIFKSEEVPDFVKNAEIVEDLTDLPDSAFADSFRRLFPVNTKAATWLSAAYFAHNQPSYSQYEYKTIKDRLIKHAKFHGCYGEGFPLNKPEIKKAEIEDSNFALVIEYNGNKERLMPIFDEITLNKAANWLRDNKESYPLSWRKLAAQNILNKAAEMQVNFSNEQLVYLEKAAGKALGNKTKAAEALFNRTVIIGQKYTPEIVPTEKQQDMVKLGGLAKKLLTMELSGIETDLFTKVAELCDSMDSKYRLFGLYKKATWSPEETIFGQSYSECRKQLQDSISIKNAVYSLKALNGVSKDLVSAGFIPEEYQDLDGSVNWKSLEKTAGKLDPETLNLITKGIALFKVKQEK